MTTLILIRHGETDWNVEGRYTGQSDVPLNAHGLSQARALAARLSKTPLQAIYASDLSRARQTAECLAERVKAPIVTDPRLREIDQGEWEGLLFEEIKARFREAWESRARQPLEVAPPGGETVGQVRERVLQAVDEILRLHPSGSVAIVAHGLALALIKAHFGREPIERVWDLIPDNTEAERIEVEV